MNNSIYYPTSDKAKSIYVNNDFLYIGLKAFSNIEDFTEAYKNPKNYDRIKKFEHRDIEKISILPNEINLKALVRDEGEMFNIKMNFNESDRANFISDISEITDLEKSVTRQNSFKGALNKIGLTVLFAVISYFLATGTTFDPNAGSTRRSRLGAKLIYSVSSILGPTLTLIIFILLTIGFGYLAWKKYNNPSELIIFGKKKSL